MNEGTTGGHHEGYHPDGKRRQRTAAYRARRARRTAAYRVRFRQRVFERDGWCCCYCGATENLTLDHVIPKSKGGRGTFTNIQTLCKPCNTDKADKLIDVSSSGVHVGDGPVLPPPLLDLRLPISTLGSMNECLSR
jgi:5-methylcytosine-specific restriction endonuclease McrA